MTALITASQLVEITQPFPQLIGGEEVFADGTFSAVDPSTGRVWADISAGTSADVYRAVLAAQRAFVGWRRTSLDTRQELLWTVAERLTQDADRWRAQCWQHSKRDRSVDGPKSWSLVAVLHPDLAAGVRRCSGPRRD